MHALGMLSTQANNSTLLKLYYTSCFIHLGTSFMLPLRLARTGSALYRDPIMPTGSSTKTTTKGKEQPALTGKQSQNSV